MASALSSVKNATAVFEVPISGVRTDPETGNVTAATRKVTMELFLKAATIGTRTMPGVDVLETVYEGYAVSPMAFEAGIVVGVKGVLSFAQEDPSECEVVELRFSYGNSGLIGGTLARVLGESVRLVSRKF
jgi:hypothetical protein